MDCSLLDRFIYEGECGGKEVFRSLLIFILDGLSELFYLAPEHGLISFVDGPSTQTSPPLSVSGSVISHVFLLRKKSYDKIYFL